MRRRPGGAAPEWLQATVTALGHDARLVAPGARPTGEVALLLVYGNAAWFRPQLAAVAAMPEAERPRVTIWHSEPLPPPRAAGLPTPRLHLRELAKIALRDERATDPYTNLRMLRRLAEQGLPDRLVVTSHGAAERLAEDGLQAAVVPIGGNPAHGRDLGLERDLDVLFLGALDVPRRRRALQRLRRSGLAVTAVGGWDDARFWGDERARLVNRARVFLNLSRHPGQFSGVRLMLGMASGALVVSEPIYRPEPFVPGRHYVESPLETMPAVVARYLDDDAERRRIATAGHELVTRKLTHERSVARVLELSGG